MTKLRRKEARATATSRQRAPAELIDEETRRQLQPMLEALREPVRLVFFTQEQACAACREQRQLLEELVALSGKLSLEVRDLIEDAEEVRAFGVSRVPTTAVVGARDYGVRFIGVTAGYEFSSLVEAIRNVSDGRSGLPPGLEQLVRMIDEPTHLEIMVTLTCPYCPKMVRLAHQMAIANDQIRSDMVDAAEFPDLVQRYEVGGVPRTVVNERPAFEGALPEAAAILEILKLASPAAYEQIDSLIRQQRGERAVHAADADHLYDVVIVGAGPAAFSAAIYAARKARDVAVVGDHPGGQVTDTALVENYLGIPEISGMDLAAAFRSHVERYDVAERLDATVKAVEASDAGFVVHTSDGSRYQARSVIYAAGKTYRRLGVPGEARFIGRGIGFCATCDAPLYHDKRVAIIGGGNSAFTAARDLLSFAREIHLINILPDWQADPLLVERVTASDRVTLHPATEVREFLGKDELTGVRLQGTDGRERVDLAVDGVFLEIGLVPNTEPVAGLLELNAQGEIPVGRDQSTTVAGFFAAGDVTDEPEKQIVVAAGAGASAALAADRYLADRGAPAADRAHPKTATVRAPARGSNGAKPTLAGKRASSGRRPRATATPGSRARS